MQQTTPTTSPSIVAGVIPGQPDLVVIKACEIARLMGSIPLHLVYVNATLIEEHGHQQPLDPDSLSDSWREESTRLSEHVLQIAHAHGADGDYRMLAGDPASELLRFAHEHQAMMIVVGTRERGALAAIEEWVNGSVAVRLSHMQDVPVLMVPLAAEYRG